MSSSSSASDAVRRLSASESSVAALLVGDEGGDQSIEARSLARSWHCLEPDNGSACGACRACGAFDRDASADFLHLSPGGPQDLIRLRQVSEDPVVAEPNVRSFLQSPPALGRNRVVWIERADRLTNDAANALLKTIEEPSERARFVLTTSASGRILPTIRSRCVLIPCGSEALPPGFAAELSGGSSEVFGRMDSAALSGFRGDLETFTARCEGAQRVEALSLADTFVELAGEWSDLRERESGEDRLRKAEFVRMFANVAGARAAHSVRWHGLLDRAIVVHRALLGNVNAAYLADWLFVSID
ncbi:MAG: hypothetical protein M3R13_03480 [Armatimonadota bacterium]|nr:hypothetical protein [Armatimonadota bacterium]